MGLKCLKQLCPWHNVDAKGRVGRMEGRKGGTKGGARGRERTGREIKER